jgi:outer membrane protein assembly factor BamB
MSASSAFAGTAGFPPCGPFPPRVGALTAIGLDGSTHWTTPLPIDQNSSSGDSLQPLVAGGLGFATSDGSVTAVSTADGQVVWQHKPGSIIYDIWLYHGVLAALVDQVSNHATVIGFDAATGAVRWRYAVPGFGLFNTVAQTRDGAVAWITADGALQALDLTTGKLRWSKQAEKSSAQVQFHAPSVLAVAGNVLFSGNARLTAYDEHTGKRRWVLTGLPGQPNPTIAAGVVLVTRAQQQGKVLGLVVAVDASTGHRLWQRAFPTTYGLDATGTADGVLVSGGPDPTFEQYLLAPRTGKLRWQAPAQLLPGYEAAAVILAHDVVEVTFTYDLYRKYTLLDRDLRTGRLRWKVALHGGAAHISGLTASGSQVYLLAGASGSLTKGAVYAYRLSTGHALWTVTAPTALFAKPAFAAGELLLPAVAPVNECPAT